MGNTNEENHVNVFFDAVAERKRSWSLPPQMQQNMGGGCESPLVVDRSKLGLGVQDARRSVSPSIRKAEMPCELHPNSCSIYESVSLLIDLASSNGCCLTDQQCIVEFTGQTSGRQVQVDAMKRNHEYGIKTKTPGDNMYVYRGGSLVTPIFVPRAPGSRIVTLLHVWPTSGNFVIRTPSD